ncbi:MAG: WS/DGAT domain-containing protein, partial [Gammaproteobacteria bacterium]
GARMINVFGMAPVIDGLGAIIVVVSYDDHLTISINASRQLLPDIDDFLKGLLNSFEELKQAVDRPVSARARVKERGRGKSETQTVRTKVRKKATSKSGGGNTKTSKQRKATRRGSAADKGPSRSKAS